MCLTCCSLREFHKGNVYERIIWLKYAYQRLFLFLKNMYTAGDTMGSRINDAVRTDFEDIDKQTGELEPLVYFNFIVKNIAAGLCFGIK